MGLLYDLIRWYSGIEKKNKTLKGSSTFDLQMWGLNQCVECEPYSKQRTAITIKSNLEYVSALLNLLIGFWLTCRCVKQKKKKNSHWFDLRDSSRFLCCCCFCPVLHNDDGDKRTCHRTSQFEIECHHLNLNVTFLVTSPPMHNWHWIPSLDVHIYHSAWDTQRHRQIRFFDGMTVKCGKKNKAENQLSRCQLRFLSQSCA